MGLSILKIAKGSLPSSITEYNGVDRLHAKRQARAPEEIQARAENMLKLKMLVIAVAACVSSPVAPAQAGETNVAVAANFTEPAKEIAELFKHKTGNEAILSFGASGPIFAQIAHDAPFQVFLSADAARPKAAVDGGYAVPGTEFTYAIGKLVLWSKVVDVTKGDVVLKAGAFSSLAMANPSIAPYGAAATEAMKALGFYDSLKLKIARRKTVGQVYQFVDEKKADVGLVALSNLFGVSAGTRWLVPQ